MDVELFTEDTSEDETYGLDDNNEDYLNFEGERCGICSDIVIDRGVLDCCQHWFCFACIDNWATITSICPLCQNEFQLITCVPVYDTVGGSKTDDITSPTRDDDWLIEGKNNTLSFPSYYIDENAVVCLDGDCCKIRSGFVAIEEDSDIDTSIACDLCDKWYHAFCVGFDPDGVSDSSWLCPRCTTDKVPQRSDRVSEFRKSYQKSLEISDDDSPAETSFSGRVSVSVADDGETAVVVSLVTGNQGGQKSSESVLGHRDMENARLSHSASDMPKSEALPDSEPYLCQRELELSLSQDTSLGLSHSILPTQLKTNANDSVKIAPEHLNSAMAKSGLNLGRGLSMSSDTFVDMKYDGVSEDHVPASVESDKRLEDFLPAENMVPNKVEEISSESMIADVNDNIRGAIGVKRKQTDHSDAEGNANNGEEEDDCKAKFSPKKLKAGEYCQPSSLVDQTSILEVSRTIKCQTSSRDGIVKGTLEKDNANNATSIMDIVRGTDRISLKQLGHKIPSDIAIKERESAAGLRLKKIMRRTGDDQDSSVLVQEIRQKLREAVRNKSSNEPGQNIFDPKLLDAFRTALAGSGAENRKPTLDVKAKNSLLQKGKVRENLTKKIYGAGGKRKRAWTRECEVEFWKHRCIKVSKPEKIQTLKSVLDVLRYKSDCEKKNPGNEEAAKGSILSRLYLADTSLLPRNDDIKPVSDINAVAISEQKRESGVTGKVSSRLPIDQPDKIHQKESSDSQGVPPLDGKDTKKLVKGTKADNVSAEAHCKRDSTGTHAPASSGVGTSAKNAVSKSGDKRKWALELLARKTATSGKNAQENDEDPTILKGNYTLVAQLPKEMRPGLAPSRHSKIPLSIRQAQLYRLTEHFLKKANLSVVCRTAETELAVADAVNIEKQIADRSNSKLVYVNLCSQELLRRPDNANPDGAKETTFCSTNSEHLSDEASEENNDISFDPVVDEALKKAGLMSDSPSNSPPHPTVGIDKNIVSPVKIDEEEPGNVLEVDSHPELDIYGDFEYNLEDDDFIGAGALNISNPQQEQPKIKLLFSSLNPEKSHGNLDSAHKKAPTDAEASEGSSGLRDSQSTTVKGVSTVDNRVDDCLVQKPSVDNDEEPSLAECEELYGPDKEPLVQKYLKTVPVAPFESSVMKELLSAENGDCSSNHLGKNSYQPTLDHVESPETSTNVPKQQSSYQERESAVKDKKTTKHDTKHSERNSEILKKVEAYIKEHIRPLCKSGVITVEQYRWAVGKTAEKVMKYHSKEKNANFLIKEGEKVKKLAEQYVEAAQQKAKT